jgi:KaiC/GvpD/RAD55 family RecA-like ATPase
MDIKKLEEKGKLEIMRLTPPISMKSMKKELIKKITDNKIKRICFDPINVLYLDFEKEENLRKEFYDFFNLLKEMNVCILVAGESDEELSSGNEDISDGISFCVYLSDSVTELFSSGISGKGDRALRIFKMRKTNHFRGPVGMEIDDKGIKIVEK